MINKLKQFIDKIKKIIADGFLAFLKDTVKGKIATITTILLGIAGTVTVTSPQMMGNFYRTITSDREAERTISLLHEELKQLRGEWKASDQTNFYERKMFEQSFKLFAETTDKNFKIIHDSLLRQNKRLEAFTQGSGTVNLTGGGEAPSGTFSDDWMDAYVEIDKEGRIRMDYVLNFLVKDISMSYEDETDGSRKEIYRVKLVSLKDTNAIYDVGSYERWTMTFAEDPKPVEEEKQHEALNLNVGYSGYGAEIGVSYSLWTFGDFKFIDLGISSDFQESTNISAGVRYNIGSLIPLVQDLFIGIHYGYNFGKDKSNPVVMIGTTL